METNGRTKSLMCLSLSRDKIEHMNYLGDPQTPYV